MDSSWVITTSTTQLQQARDAVPPLFANAGDNAIRRFVEFFTANIRNHNTRMAYVRAAIRFAHWCDRDNIQLEQLTPFIVAAYIEELGQRLSKPSVKQHLAAIRMLFDYLVTGQVLPMNPAYAVRGPKHVVKKGLTPVLTAEETRVLLDSIDTSKIAGLRDRAIIGVMVYSFARVSAVCHLAGYTTPLVRGKGGSSVLFVIRVPPEPDAWKSGPDCAAARNLLDHTFVV